MGGVGGRSPDLQANIFQADDIRRYALSETKIFIPSHFLLFFQIPCSIFSVPHCCLTTRPDSARTHALFCTCRLFGLRVFFLFFFSSFDSLLWYDKSYLSISAAEGLLSLTLWNACKEWAPHAALLMANFCPLFSSSTFWLLPHLFLHLCCS